MPSANMSSRLEDTSAILGEYMLKGWTLTDLHCDTCHTTPLMREPAGSASAAGRDRIQFCALCDGSPTGRAAPVPAPTTVSAPIRSRAPSNPAPAPVDPSQSISNLLLQGYALLGENCPNGTCRGIPLVGYPKKKDGSKDGRKMCVSCGGRWVDGNDLSGMTLVGAVSGPGAGTSASGTGGMSGGGESPRSKARREMYGLAGPSAPVASMSSKGKESAVAPDQMMKGSAEGNEDDYDMKDDEEYLKGLQNTTSTQASNNKGAAQPVFPSHSSDTNPELATALTKTSSSLSKTLDRIASSLDRHTESNREEGRYFVDVKLHTEAIKDVMTVLDMVKRFKP